MRLGRHGAVSFSPAIDMLRRTDARMQQQVRVKGLKHHNCRSDVANIASDS